MQKIRGRQFTPYLYLLPVIALFAILLLYPMVEILHYSLLDKAITSKNPAFAGLGNYKYVLTDDTFWTALFNSLIFTIVSVVAHICLGMAFALIINSENINVTISLGVYQLQSSDEDVDLLQKADNALYQAKSDGRNKVVVYDIQ